MSRSSLEFLFKGRDAGLKSASRDAARGLDNVDAAAGGVNSRFGNMLSIGRRLGGALAAMGIAQLALDTIDLAKNLAGLERSMERIYGVNAPALRASLDEVRLSLGLSRGELDQQLVRLGTLATGMGMNAEQAAQFAGQIVTLGGDLAAGAGELTAAGDAVHALGRALVGEYDPLERFVGGVKQAVVNQRALAMTGKEATEELTDQEKAVALLAVVNERGAASIGALSAAQDDEAVKANRATAAMRDQQEQLGQKLLPVYGQFMEILAQITPALSLLVSWIGMVMRAFELWLRPIVAVIEYLSPLVQRWLPKLGELAETLAFGPLRTMRSALEGIVGWVQRLIDWIGRIPRNIPNPFRGLGNLVGKLPGFSRGGNPQGPAGKPQLAIVHGDEEINRTFTRPPGGPEGGVTIVVELDRRAIVRAILPELTRYIRIATGIRER